MDHLSLDELREAFAKEFPSLPANENPFNDPPVRPEPEPETEPEPALPKQIQRRRIRNTGIAKRSRSEIIQPKLAKKPTRPRREDEQAPSDKKATDDKATSTPDDGATSSERATPTGADAGQATASSRRTLTLQEFTDLTDNLLGLGLDFGGSSNMSLNSTNGNYPSYLEGPPANQGAGGGGMQRQAPSPLSQQQVNNNGGPNGVGGLLNGLGMGMPIPAGQQMDLNLIFKHVNDLSEALRENREKTQGIVASAEELAVSIYRLLDICFHDFYHNFVVFSAIVCTSYAWSYASSPRILSSFFPPKQPLMFPVGQTRAAASGAIPSLQEANHEISGMWALATYPCLA